MNGVPIGWLRGAEGVCTYLGGGVSPRTIYNWFDQGLRRVKVGNTLLVKPEWVDRFIMEQDSADHGLSLDEIANAAVADVLGK